MVVPTNVNEAAVRVRYLTTGLLFALVPMLMGADEQERPIQQLDGVTRARVLAAIVGLIILGFAAIALAWMAMRAARRRLKTIQKELGSSKYAEFGIDDWATKPLIPTDKSPAEDENDP